MGKRITEFLKENFLPSSVLLLLFFPKLGIAASSQNSDSMLVDFVAGGLTGAFIFFMAWVFMKAKEGSREAKKRKGVEIKEKPKPKPLLYVCKYCGDRFKKQDALVFHIRTCSIGFKK